MKRSLETSRGTLTEYCMVLKNNTDMISAIEAHDVGWLEREEIIRSDRLNTEHRPKTKQEIWRK